jgi:hypothetical protein
MNSEHRTTSQARRRTVGVGMVVGAGVAAAIIGMPGAPAAHADDGSASTDLIGLLDSAAADMTEANDVLHNIPGVVVVDLGGVIGNAADTINQFEAIQEPLLSSDNNFWSGLGDFLFADPDQQLNQASDAFLTATQAVAADPSSLIAGLELSLAGFQYTDTVLFDSLLPNAVGWLIDQLFGIGSFDAAASSAADVAAGVGADVAGSAGANLAAGFDLPF